jgi:hypothetical protein
MQLARRVAITAIVAATFALFGNGCAKSNCDYSVLDGAIFFGTVSSVADDGRATLAVESVVTVSDAGTVPRPPVFGVTTPATASAELSHLSAGVPVTVQFPLVQVAHLRRDIGKRYKVVASLNQSRTHLEADLQDMDLPCGRTVLADE